MLIIANAVMKKNAITLKGRLRTNSIHRSLTFTFSASFWSITTRSLHCENENTRSASPARAKIVMVTNHADAASGVFVMAEPSAALGAKMAITSGSDLTTRAPRLAMNIRVDVRMVTSSVSRVSDELRAP